MVKIRLKKFGSKKRPYYRIVVQDSQAPRDGRVIEEIGIYHPIEVEEKQISFNEERARYWIGVGAQPTDTVKNLDKIEMLEQESEGYSEARGGRGRSSYMGGSSYDDDMMYSERRGRGRNARRDSMGRYSRDNYSGNYSRDHSETISKMRNLMNETSDDRTRREIQRLISEMENG